MKACMTFVLAVLLPKAALVRSEAYDTDYLKAFYCYQLAESPRLAIDLSNEEKSAGEATFFGYLQDRGLSMPTNGIYDDATLKFSVWVMQDMGGDKGKVMTWYHINCTGRSSGKLYPLTNAASP